MSMTEQETQVWIAAYCVFPANYHRSHARMAAAEAVLAYRDFENNPEKWRRIISEQEAAEKEASKPTKPKHRFRP